MKKTKMTFVLPKDDDGYPPDDFETMWVEVLGQSLYRIDNIPFYICDVSPDDVVEGEMTDRFLGYKRTIKKSNSSVIRLVFFDRGKAPMLLARLTDYGCKWEGSHLANLFSIEVPDRALLDKVRELLKEASGLDILDYEEASIR